MNKNEPIVCTPEEALDCFLRTRMDVLVMGPYVLERVAFPTLAYELSQLLPPEGGSLQQAA